MKAVIIEDEEVAAQALALLLEELYPDITVLATLQSVEDSVEWLRTHAAPDLLFMDIHLSDDSSFSIFDKVAVTCPVIFTTAYDKYALRAFEVNSIDYLLKPVHQDNLQHAIEKYRRLSAAKGIDSGVIASLLETIRREKAVYKSYLLVSNRDKLIPLAVKDIAYIHVDVKVVIAVTFDNRNHYLSQPLDELMEQLSPQAFYRANRQYIVARSAVKDVSAWFGSKLAVNLTVSAPEKIYVSKARAKNFKEWLTG
ncbi:MAG: LytTR family DNA-binding domain-containing protein [Prevotellaceae bacterium]|jgi:two-component system LytT family response regulator|nr:LytTR family DNA-binding domain-containing protein [Prevotellaceae bacterium]